MSEGWALKDNDRPKWQDHWSGGRRGNQAWQVRIKRTDPKTGERVTAVLFTEGVSLDEAMKNFFAREEVARMKAKDPNFMILGCEVREDLRLHAD